MTYELCYLIGESKEQELSKIKEEIANIVSKEGGQWLEPQIEEKRKMAYKVRKEVRGIFVAQQFKVLEEENEAGDGEKKNVVGNINKKLNLNQNILRFIIVKAEDLPELKARGAVRYNLQGETGSKNKKPIRKSFYEKKFESVSTAGLKKKTKEVAPVLDKEKNKKEKTADENKSIDEKIDEILNI